MKDEVIVMGILVGILILLAIAISVIIISVDIGIDTGEDFGINATVVNIDTGERFELIQEAVDDSDTTDGHTIVVGPGVYHENVQVDKSLTIKSVNESCDDVTIIGKKFTHNIINVVNCSDVDIIGFRVIGGKIPASAGAGDRVLYSPIGISLNLAQNCYIANCSVNRSNMGVFVGTSSNNNTIEHNNIYGNQKQGVCLQDSEDITIINNNIYDNQGGGLFMSYLCNITIENNNIYNNDQRGGVFGDKLSNAVIINNNIYNNYPNSIYCHPRPEGLFLSRLNNAVIGNNNIYNNSIHGIDLPGSNNTVIKNNNVYDNSQGIYLPGSNNVVIENNDIYDNGGQGIDLSGNNAVISNNTISGHCVSTIPYQESDYYGVEISRATISNNTFAFTKNCGVKMSQTTNSTISNNTLTKNGNGIELYKVIDSAITGNNISYNIKNGIYLADSLCGVGGNIICSATHVVRWNDIKAGIYLSDFVREIRGNIICSNAESAIHVVRWNDTAGWRGEYGGHVEFIIEEDSACENNGRERPNIADCRVIWAYTGNVTPIQLS